MQGFPLLPTYAVIEEIEVAIETSEEVNAPKGWIGAVFIGSCNLGEMIGEKGIVR